MAVNPVQFLVASNASITDGSKVVNISGNVDCSRVFSGTAVFLGGADNPAEAVSGTSPDGSGNSTITLRNNWSQGDVVNQQMVTFNTNEGLAEAISNVREIVSNVSAIEDLATEGLIKRIDDNTYEIVNISAVGESLITANDASSQRSVLGLGGAATKNVGTSAGNVMEVGAFGIGTDNQTDIPTDNIDTNTTASGIYRTDGLTEGTFPAGFNKFGTVIITRLNDVQAGQIYIDALGNTASRFYSNAGTAWGDWKVNYHSGNSVNPLDYGLGLATSSADSITDFGLNEQSGFYKALGGVTDAPETATFNSSVVAYPASTGTNFLYQRNVSNASDIRAWLGCTRPQTNDVSWAELYHSGNTNFNEFGGSGANKIVATGYGQTSTTIKFFLPINSNTQTFGISVSATSGFNIVDATFNVIEPNKTPTYSSASSNKLCVIEVTGLSGVTADSVYYLRQNNAADKITVNF